MSTVSPTPCSDQVPSQCTGEMGQPPIAEQDAAQADALAAVQQITQVTSPNLMYHLRIYLFDGFL